MPFLSQLIGHPADRVAVIDEAGEHSYGALLEQSRYLASQLVPPDQEEGEYIAFMADRNASSVVALLAIWLAGGVAVPLDPLMPLPEWEWRIRDAVATRLVFAPEKKGEALYLAQRCGIQTIETTSPSLLALPLKPLPPEQKALVFYTSGTSRHPRGVVHTFSSIEAQVKTLCQAWHWESHDHLLHVLPISHLHGLVCGLLCTMAAGACCELLSSFKTERAWERLATGQFTLLTAVPTIYQYMLDSWDKEDADTRQRWQDGARQLRLAIVGSSPLPPGTHRHWQKLTGKPLLIRYGLTEAGMVFSQLPEGSPCPECMGSPLPGVNVRLVDDTGRKVDEIGELEVRSPQMFSGYHRKDELNMVAFNHGWFRTGDMVMFDKGQYRLLGRHNIDIIKTGGYRVSALEVEARLGAHPGVKECAVLGIPHENLGESICACIVPGSHKINLEEIRQWLCTQLAPYKLPTCLSLLEQLPKTNVGKIDKQSLKRELSMPHPNSHEREMPFSSPLVMKKVFS